MKTLDQHDIDILLAEPIFRCISRGDRARLLMHASQRILKVGETLFDFKTCATQVFLVRSGALRIEKNSASNRTTVVQTAGYVGEEVVLGATGYQSTAVAEQPTVVFGFPARVLADLVARYEQVKALLFDSWTRGGDATVIPCYPRISVPVEDRLGAHLLGWIGAIAIPIIIWKLCQIVGLNRDAAYFLAIISSAVTMWVFSLVPAFIPPLFSVLAAILFDVAPPEVALAGFSSSGFFMLLSIFTIGALMVMSGLTYRISLHILKLVPASPFWYNISLFSYGLILTPVIPSQLGRTTIVLPFLSTLIDTGNGKKNNPAVAQFIFSAMAGVGLGASIFLTGKPANLIIFGLFDLQTQFAFAWLQWLIAASFTGIMLIALYALIAIFLFKHVERSGIPKHVIRSQIRVLGPMAGIEWSALIAIALVIVGILTTTLHKVEIAWMSMAIMVVLLLFGSVQRDDMSNRVDWTILIFIASIVIWVPIMKLTGLDRLIFNHFSWVGGYMKTQLPLFILVLSVGIIAIRLALPEIVAEILLVTLLLPLASEAGVSPWLIGFIVLTMCEAYIFPYQSPYHLQLKNHLAQLGQDALYDQHRVIYFNILLTFARVIAIYASLPFWKYMDIL